MSKHHAVHNFHLAESSRTNHSGLLTLTALLLGGLAVPASAQNRAPPRVVPERHFALAPSVYTPMALKTEPYAATNHFAALRSEAEVLVAYSSLKVALMLTKSISTPVPSSAL
jgi:hypothetical protein